MCERNRKRKRDRKIDSEKEKEREWKERERVKKRDWEVWETLKAAVDFPRCMWINEWGLTTLLFLGSTHKHKKIV